MALAFFAGRSRSLAIATNVGGIPYLNSLPFYYGALTAVWCAIPSLVVLLIWNFADNYFISNMIVAELPESALELVEGKKDLLVNQVYNVAEGIMPREMAPDYIVAASERLEVILWWNRMLLAVVCLSIGILGSLFVWMKITPKFKARLHVEGVFLGVLFVSACIAILTTVGIVFSVLFESIKFFTKVPITEFLFGLEWSPQMAIREGQQGSSGSFGAVPLFVGTLLIAAIAMIVAVPTGLMSAIYLSEYADRRIRDWVKPALEVLAGVPTVVYGFFAALTVAPFIRDMGIGLGLDGFMTISSESALAAGLVMGVMIIPFVSSLSDDVINAVPQSLRDGALGLGSTRSEVIKQVVLPAALPGIMGGILLAGPRAIGETMIVVMAAGLAANLTMNPLDSVTTVTVQIVTLLVGDQEFNSPKTLAAFALGLVLFIVTLGLNYLALHIVKKYREQYD